MKSTINAMFSRDKRSNIGDEGSPNAAECELRPGGMLVQKRDSNVNKTSALVSAIRVKVKYGSSYHEIRISSHASFGELKKMLAEPAGLHPLDQKLFFKNKERDSRTYLDELRVKDGSKMVLLVDTESRERRKLETIKFAKKEKTSKSLMEINMVLDTLAKQVAALEKTASMGGIIEEMDVENLTENLMRILIKLDETEAEGDLKLQRREQVRRVQKQIETLDMLKMTHSIPLKNDNNMTRESKVHLGVQKFNPRQNGHERRQRNAAEKNLTEQQPLKHSEPVGVTTKWETFD